MSDCSCGRSDCCTSQTATAIRDHLAAFHDIQSISTDALMLFHAHADLHTIEDAPESTQHNT